MNSFITAETVIPPRRFFDMARIAGRKRHAINASITTGLKKTTVIKAMIGKKSGEIVTRHLRDIIAFKISDYLKQQAQTEPKMRNLIAEAAAAAMISLITNWMEDGMVFSPVEIADKAQKLLMKILD